MSHGTHAEYCAGCRCFPCRLAHSKYNEHREKQIAYGRWRPYVDAEPVRQHVRSLMAAGVGYRRVALLAGVTQQTMIRLLYGETDWPPSKRIRPDSAMRIMAVRPTLDAIGHTTPVDATGTHRRLQALIAIGWSQTKLGRELGIDGTNVSRMLASDRVWAANARAVRDLYERLWDQGPPEEGWRDKIAANRSRAYAVERGWAPPLAWNEEEIDDPAAVPVGAGYEPPKQGKLPAPAEIEHLVQGGDSLEVIADRYGVNVRSIREKLSRPQKKETTA